MSVIALAGVAMGLASPGARAAEEHPLNVLFIVSDDQRHDTLGAAGNTIVRTPTLDRLAREGVRFTHAFVPLPLCTPSRASYLTGQFPSSNCVTFFRRRIPENTPTWPQALAQRGYITAFTGKWHNVRGFDEYGFQRSSNAFIAGMGTYTDPLLLQGPKDKPKQVKGNITELFTDAAVRFLDTYDGSKPFFLYVAYTSPHDPRTPPPEYEKMYDPGKMPLWGNFMPRPRFDPGTLDIRDEKLLPMPRDPALVRREIGKYYGLITHMDAQIGRIMATLERRDLARNTIVIFVSDNGLTLGSHGLLGKQILYDEGVRVPMIIRHPRLGHAGQTRDAFVYLLDLFPTVCEWTGTPIPDSVQGKSLAAVYTGQSPGVRDTVFGQYDEDRTPLFRMIRTDRYKLIQYLQLDKEELFDLKNDPLELTDLAGDPQMESTRRELHDRLLSWRQEQEKAQTACTQAATP